MSGVEGMKWGVVQSKKEIDARYYQSHKEQVIERNKKYVEKNKEKVRERKARWYQKTNGVKPERKICLNTH